MAKTGNIAQRYATALFALAGDKGLHDAVAADLGILVKAVDESADLRRMLNSPILARSAQDAALQALAVKAGLTETTRRFLGKLATNRRLPLLLDVATLYRAKLAALRGEHTAEVTSASPLRPGQIETLRDALASRLGGRVTLDLKVDPELLGGLIIRMGSRLIDSSIRSKLDRIGYRMKGTV